MWLGESRALQLASIVYRTTNENRRKRQRELGGEASKAERKAKRKCIITSDFLLKEYHRRIRCGDSGMSALKEECKRDWTLQFAIDYVTGDSTYDKFMKHVRSKAPPPTTIPFESIQENDEPALFDAVRARLIEAMDIHSSEGTFWLFRGSVGDYNNTFFSASTALRHALEFAGRNGLRENSVLQVYLVDASRHKFLPVYEVSEYGKAECEVIVHGTFQKACEFQWQSPLGDVRVVVYT